MRTKIAPRLLAGVALWAGLTACSAAVDPAPETRTSWSGSDDVVAPPSIPGPPLAISWDDFRRGHPGVPTLTRLDPQTLETDRGPRMPVAGSLRSAPSPDGSELLLTSGRHEVSVIDPRRMSLLRTVELPAGFRSAELSWIEDRVAIATTTARGAATFLRFDPTTGEVLGRRRLEGDVFEVVQAREGVVVLAARNGPPWPEQPGPVTIGAMHASGELVSRTIEDVRAGFFLPDEDDPGGGSRLEPGLAVRGSVATVVGVDGTIVAVDLTDMTVTEEGRDGSFFAAVGRWFAPPAEAKSLDATSLDAAWVSSDALVVAGSRTDAPSGEGRNLEESKEPAGAVLVDATDGSRRTLDPDATIATPAGDLVLASQDYVPGQERGESIGLRAYDVSGELVWEAFEGAAVWEPVVSGRYAIVTFGWDEMRVRVVDLATGEVLGSRPSPLIILPW